MKAILLARVSSSDQEDTHSIPAQVERVTKYSKNKNIEILKIFKLTEKSTSQNRKQYNEIIKLIKSSKKKIALVVETIDRLQRDFKESVELDRYIKSEKLEIHFIRENLILNRDSNSSDVMRWDMGVMFAKNYLLQMKDNVARSVRSKLEKGEYPANSPIGYINYRDQNDNSRIVLDPDRAHLVKKKMELYGK